MKSTVEAVRAITVLNAAAIDRSHAETDPDRRREAEGLADLLTPISKSLSTDAGVEMASLGIQVFGGMGFIEETGAAQYYRDARIAPIYEGTNGIQALDLVGRKLRLDGGRPWRSLVTQMRTIGASAAASDRLSAAADELGVAIAAVIACSEWLEDQLDADPESAAAGATPYLRLLGTTLGAALLLEQAAEAERRLSGSPDHAFLKAKVQSAIFYATQILPAATALRGAIMAGAGALDPGGLSQ